MRKNAKQHKISREMSYGFNDRTWQAFQFEGAV